MTSSSVSFRITRHAEDLAETLHALSHRLVAMEQRLGALELQLTRLKEQPRQDSLEVTGLAEADAHIERLLLDCRELLAVGAEQPMAEAQLPLQQDDVTGWVEQPEIQQEEAYDAA